MEEEYMDHQAFAQLLGNYGEFVGAIAVVVTLAYLAVQIRQNTKSMDETRKLALVDSYVRRNESIERSMMHTTASEELSELLVRYDHEGLDSLTPVERYRVATWERARQLRVESQFFQYQHGFLDEEYYEHQFKGVVVLAAPRWKELEVGHGRPSFQAAIEDILSDELVT
jgi:hypothetical protein